MPEPSSNQDVFDVRKIRRLVELMKEYDLGEMDLKQGETRIQLRRGSLMAVAPAAAAPASAPAQPAAAAAAPAPATAPAVAAEPANVRLVKSPMVGTFYATPDPDSPPYVKIGDHVGPETTVCIIEAMKVFNQIPAEASGKIVAVLVESGQAVEYGQPLFKLAVGE
jgi:acetyl-CoA carboxylase biotin carboxyl carrier protein